MQSLSPPNPQSWGNWLVGNKPTPFVWGTGLVEDTTSPPKSGGEWATNLLPPKLRGWGSESLDGSECGIVVGFGGDFRHILDVLERTLWADDEDGTGMDTSEGAFCDENAVGVPKAGIPMVRGHLDFVNAFGSTETPLGKRKVGADREDGNTVGKLRSLLIELFGLQGADGGVKRGNDREKQSFACKVVESHLSQTCVGTRLESESRGFFPNGELRACEGNGVSLKVYGSVGQFKSPL